MINFKLILLRIIIFNIHMNINLNFELFNLDYVIKYNSVLININKII